MNGTIVSFADRDLPLGEKHFTRCCRDPSCFLCTTGNQSEPEEEFFLFSCRDHMSGVTNDLTVYGVERHDFVDCYALALPSLPFQLSLTPVSAPVLAIPIENLRLIAVSDSVEVIQV